VRFPTESQVAEFHSALQKSSVRAVYLHAAYLVNLASPKKDIWEKSVHNLTGHLQIAEMLGANGLIFHTGSGTVENLVRGMKEVLKKSSGNSQLIMETSSGGGEKIGDELDELAEVFHAVNSPRVKICFDTAHAFAAGMIEGYERGQIKKFFDEFEKKIGLENLVAIHANDSQAPANSKKDRHENLGRGHIGLAGFQNLAKEKRLHHAAWLLEVPGFAGEGPDKENLEILRGCFGKLDTQ
jgi:deoxyribonuclease-4